MTLKRLALAVLVGILGSVVMVFALGPLGLLVVPGSLLFAVLFNLVFITDPSDGRINRRHHWRH